MGRWNAFPEASMDGPLTLMFVYVFSLPLLSFSSANMFLTSLVFISCIFVSTVSLLS